MAGLQRVSLNNLNISMNNALIIGIIIAKGGTPRTFSSKKKGSETRGVTSFTIRDSPLDVINCDVWGSEYFIITFYESFQVGDVVEIANPSICIKQGDRSEKFRPQVSSPFYLSLKEGMCDVHVHVTPGLTFLPLLHIPTKPPHGYYAIADVLNLTNVEGEMYVDLLAVVRSVSVVKPIRTKNDTAMSVRTVNLMDNSTPAMLTLQIFDQDTIQRAEHWSPCEMVLFISDARVSWNAFERRPVVGVNGRTIITEQPHTPEAEALRVNVRATPNVTFTHAHVHLTEESTSLSVVSVRQVLDRMSTGNIFAVQLSAFVTQLDLDGIRRLVTTFCSMCGLGVESRACGCVGGAEGKAALDLRVSLSDHTGTLQCRLCGDAAEKVLGCTASEFLNMDLQSRGVLKWRFLLERCSARVHVAPPARAALLALTRADEHDAANVPIY